MNEKKRGEDLKVGDVVAGLWFARPQSLRAEYEAGLSALMGPEYQRRALQSREPDHFTEATEAGRKVMARGRALSSGLVAVFCEHDADIPCSSVGCPNGGPKCKACGGPCSSAEEVCERCGK